MKEITILFLATLTCCALQASGSPQVNIDTCESCHGKYGVSHNPIVPTIAGLPAINIEDALLGFTSGLRPDAHMPEKQSHNLEKDSISVFAQYFSKQEFSPAVQPYKTARVELGKRVFALKCASCHTEAGSEPEDEASLLAGQHSLYLSNQIKAFMDGTRKDSSGVRKDAFDGLRGKHINALLDYLASQ